MSAKAGRDILVKIKNETGDFVSLAGLRAKSLRFNARPIDVTDSESIQAWRELLPGAGTKTAEITGAGVFRDKPSDALAREAFFAQSAAEYQFIIPGFGTLSGLFIISALSYAGNYQGEASFEMTLQSAGAAEFIA
jgi:TP901-1 family phage major tail protein